MSLQLIRPDINLDSSGSVILRRTLDRDQPARDRAAFTKASITASISSAAASRQIEFTFAPTATRFAKRSSRSTLARFTVQDFGKAGHLSRRFQAARNIGGIGPSIEKALDKTYGQASEGGCRVESVAQSRRDRGRRGRRGYHRDYFHGVYIAIQSAT